MPAGLNQMVAKAKWPSKTTTQHTELKHTHISPAVLIRHSLKHENTVSQKPPTETQNFWSSKISQVFKNFKGRKGSQVERRRGKRRERGAKGVALQTSPATYRYPGVMGLFPGPPEKGGLELGPTRNQTRPEPEFKFSAKRRWSVSNPQLRPRALRPDSCIQHRGTRKTGKDRKG